MSVHFSSKTDMWETPTNLFIKYDDIYNFKIDVCATLQNSKCPEFFSPEVDGLKQKWTGTCWMNPPYGKVIGAWMKKAYESSLSGATVVCLVPARTDTKWWHDYAMKGEIEFLRGRIKFGGHKNCAPFPSAIVVFDGNARAQPKYKRVDLGEHGCISPSEDYRRGFYEAIDDIKSKYGDLYIMERE